MFAVIEALQPAINMAVHRFRERARTVAQHERIYRALKDRDAGAAERTDGVS